MQTAANARKMTACAYLQYTNYNNVCWRRQMNEKNISINGFVYFRKVLQPNATTIVLMETNDVRGVVATVHVFFLFVSCCLVGFCQFLRTLSVELKLMSTINGRWMKKTQCLVFLYVWDFQVVMFCCCCYLFLFFAFILTAIKWKQEKCKKTATHNRNA